MQHNHGHRRSKHQGDTPHPPMPGIPLTLAEIDDVAAYILSLK
jgi:mono/diheme cytochrome c family protein